MIGIKLGRFDTEVLARNKLFRLGYATFMFVGGLCIYGFTKKYDIYDVHHILTYAFLVWIAIPLFYSDLKIDKPLSGIVRTAAFMFTLNAAVVCLLTIAFVSMQGTEPYGLFHNHAEDIHVIHRIGIDQATFAGHSILVFVAQTFVIAPLCEELFRGNLQKGLSAFLGEELSLLLVALTFALLHEHQFLQLLPGFVLLGILVKYNVSWGVRALVHSLLNLFVFINSITLALGGSQLTGKTSILISLGLQVAVFALLTVHFLPRFNAMTGAIVTRDKTPRARPSSMPRPSSH